jgi:hypothetical protein
MSVCEVCETECGTPVAMCSLFWDTTPGMSCGIGWRSLTPKEFSKRFGISFRRAAFEGRPKWERHRKARGPSGNSHQRRKALRAERIA